MTGPLTWDDLNLEGQWVSQKLIEVVSFWAGCARPGKPGVYAEVSTVLSWVKQITQSCADNVANGINTDPVRCLTTGGGKTLKPCDFPSSPFPNTKYNKCIKVENWQITDWCPRHPLTLSGVDPSCYPCLPQNQLNGSSEPYCNAQCPQADEENIKEGCQTTGGGNADKKCVFPFKFYGVMYNGCTTVTDDKLWCSTLTNNGVHVGGQNQWGYCNAQCPVDDPVDNKSNSRGEPIYFPLN